MPSGYNSSAGGHWDGTGITSSSARSNSANLTALGVILNNQSGQSLFNATNLFHGFAPGASDVLVQYTYFGDANLDGKVDGSDYSLIDNGYLTSATGWYNGDFNYDGVIDGSDYTLIDNACSRQGADLMAALGTSEMFPGMPVIAIPEPDPGFILLPSVVLLLGRRGRMLNMFACDDLIADLGNALK